MGAAGLRADPGTAFTYQGRLNDSGAPATGAYDIQFGAYDALEAGNLVGGLVTNTAVMVSNGLFTTTIDFGGGVFTGLPLWLDIAVSTNGANAFGALTPRQPLTPAPYAMYSENASTATTATSVASGVVAAGQLNTVGPPTPGQVLAFNGAQLSWQDPVIGGNTGGWSVTGNVGTLPGANFLGTLDAQPLELKVGGGRALRLEPDAAGSSPNVIGGSPANSVTLGVVGATIAGGGALSASNTIASNYGFIGGGANNSISEVYATIAGGGYNAATGPEGTVGGGYLNTAAGNISTVAGGYANSADGNDYWFLYNPDFTSAGYGYGCCAVGGGSGNVAMGAGATVPGGVNNVAKGAGSFAAGLLAKATNAGSFVWSDYTIFGGPFASTRDNQFILRASGGVGIGTSQTPPGGLRVASGGLAVTGASSPQYPGSSGLFLEKLGNSGGAVFAYDYVGGGPSPLALNSPGGNVGVGTASPTVKLHVYDSVSVSHRIETGGGNNAWARVEFANGNGWWNVGTSRSYNGDQLYFNRQGVSSNAFALQPNSDALFSGRVGIGVNSPAASLDVNGAIRTHSILITGGADVAEPFRTGPRALEKGSVVVIDREHPGELALSERAYDTRVAGIVSGANGVNPGIALHQDGALEGGQNVALSGRVYVLADATSGAIEPGDLLTTSLTPGHAMRVEDHARAQGAILGKAMTGLSSGKGMVLVLVTLQ
jgi:hypothetical protein